ncbi:MAG: radical SAM protein [Lachnospiraceae bacterium]
MGVVPMERNFLYLKGIDEADVLFHIKSSKFYRIFDPELMRKFRNHFWDGKSENEMEEKLKDIDEGNSSCIVDCSECKGSFSRNPKEFVINKLALVLTSKCNLRCKYCYANYGMYDYAEETDISQSTLLDGLRYLQGNYKDIANIQFFGGEPSLCETQILSTVYFFENLVETGEKDKMPTFGIVTNGVYMPESLMELFVKYNFQITISLDGPESINNTLRCDINGTGKFDVIEHNYNKLLEKGMKHIGIECTYTAEHIKNKISLVDLVKYFYEKFNCSVPHIVPVNIEKENELNVLNCMNEYLIYVKELVDYTFEKMQKEQIINSTAIITGIIFKVMYRQGQQRICPAGVKTFSLSHDSRISPCFMYTSKQDISYGKVGDDPAEILRKAYEFDDRINNKDMSKECTECPARSICSSCLGSFEIENANVHVDNPIFCETIRYVVEYVIQKLSAMKADEAQWKKLNDFLRNGVNEK